MKEKSAFYAMACFAICAAIAGNVVFAEGNTVRPVVTEIEFPTYGFSDPDPVPRTASPLSL